MAIAGYLEPCCHHAAFQPHEAPVGEELHLLLVVAGVEQMIAGLLRGRGFEMGGSGESVSVWGARQGGGGGRGISRWLLESFLARSLSVRGSCAWPPSTDMRARSLGAGRGGQLALQRIMFVSSWPIRPRLLPAANSVGRHSDPARDRADAVTLFYRC